MQNSVIHIIKELEGAEQLESCLSFKGFVNFLKERLPYEKTMKSRFLEFVIHTFEQRLQGKETFELDEMSQYTDLMELIYTCVFPVLADEKKKLWALSVPVSPVFIYGTEALYNLLRDPISKASKACMMEHRHVRKKLNYQHVYSIILKALYNIEFPSGPSIIRSWVNEATGLSSFYKLIIDTRFVEVLPKGPLPDIDPQLFNSHLSANEIVEWLKVHVPLTSFRFEGITALTMVDVTVDYVVESIKNIILSPVTDCEMGSHQEEVIHYLKILGGSNDINFGLLPFLKVNDKPVFSSEICHHSVMAAAVEDESRTQETYLALVENYFADPKLVVYESVPTKLQGEPAFLEALRHDDIHAYGLVPVYNNNELAGVLEVSSHKEGLVDSDLLSRLEGVLPLLAQLLVQTIDRFDERINAIVKENFTSIQPAVEWKFNEAAWHYERKLQLGEPTPLMETIYFKDVYPLYGAIDIRNSTIERNSALRKDLQVQFSVLTATLESLKEAVSLPLLEELLYQSRKWERGIAGALTTADEMNLSFFLKDKAGVFFNHFKESRPDVAYLIRPYLEAIDEQDGIAFRHRRELEESIQLINKTISRHLDKGAEEIQKSYPSYFEKFRTDGVEYDIYIGQAIAPDHPFDLLYLRNLRLWQLHSMATIARLTHALLPQMPEHLQTTQLIFVHSAAIDISFRKDERRFDVEGGYNIRYQVVKKRIDKVHVLETNERLTQPGMIAIIYFNDREAEEYAGYIKYLQEQGMLHSEVEHLELEELQGVSGLRALRVAVKW